MKQLKLNLDDRVNDRLQALSAELGISVQDYIRLILGQHVKHKEAG